MPELSRGGTAGQLAVGEGGLHIRHEEHGRRPARRTFGEVAARREVEMDLALTEEEAGLLRKTLEETFRDLRVEIRHTHESDLREELRHREHLLTGILARLGDPVPAAV